MKKKERHHRLGLTLLFTALVLCFMIIFQQSVQDLQTASH